MSGESFGPLFAFMSSVTWAIGSTGYSKLSQRYSAVGINFVRSIFGICFYTIIALSWNGPTETWLAWQSGWPIAIGWLFVSVIASYGAGDTLFLLSTRYLGIPGAMAIASCYPIWAALAGMMFRGEYLVGLQWIGLASALVGVAVVILFPARDSGGLKPEFARGQLYWGVFLAVATSLLWGVNSYAVSQGGKEILIFPGNVARMFFALLATGALGIGLPRQGKAFLLNLADFKRFGWVFAVECCFGSFFYMYGLSHSSLVLGSTLSALAPVISVPVAWIMKTESPTLARTGGVFLTVLGLVFLTRT